MRRQMNERRGNERMNPRMIFISAAPLIKIMHPKIEICRLSAEIKHKLNDKIYIINIKFSKKRNFIAIFPKEKCRSGVAGFYNPFQGSLAEISLMAHTDVKWYAK